MIRTENDPTHDTDPVAAQRHRIGVQAAWKFVENFLIRRTGELDAGLRGPRGVRDVRWWELTGRIDAYGYMARACGVGTDDSETEDSKMPDDARAREYLELPELARLRKRGAAQDFLHSGPDTSAEETP